MTKLKVKQAYKWDRIGSFTRGDPYTIAFVYPQDDKPFVLKGGLNNINFYLKNSWKPAIVHKTYWYKGHSRRVIVAINCDLDISFFHYKSTFRKEMVIYRKGKVLYGKVVRRIPRKWVSEIDQFLVKSL